MPESLFETDVLAAGADVGATLRAGPAGAAPRAGESACVVVAGLGVGAAGLGVGAVTFGAVEAYF